MRHVCGQMRHVVSIFAVLAIWIFPCNISTIAFISTTADLSRPSLSPTKTTSFNAWSASYQLDDIDNNVIRQSCEMKEQDSRIFDLSSPREWLEYRETIDQAEGAYTVLRCDCSTDNDKKEAAVAWNIWDFEFHLERLCRSFLVLPPAPLVPAHHLEVAQEASKRLLKDYALPDARSTILLDVKNREIGSDCQYILMVTFLWTLRGLVAAASETTPISVRVHCCTLSVKCTSPLPSPIDATLAMTTQDVVFEDLPSRFRYNPRAKLSSWCRRRRPLETMFGPGEVLLTRPNVGTTVEILEGLTSNFFVVDRNGTLKTNADDASVLPGCSQNLVMNCAAQLGFEVRNEPILLEGMEYWDEVFLTSSVKLIVPVTKIWKLAEGWGKTATRQACWVATREPRVSSLLYKTLLEYSKTEEKS